MSEPELQRIHPLVPLFEQVLIQPSTSEFIHSLKLTVVSCMLNTPKGYMRALADKEGKVLRALEGILAVQLDSTKERYVYPGSVFEMYSDRTRSDSTLT